jgi:hypothetical protein
VFNGPGSFALYQGGTLVANTEVLVSQTLPTNSQVTATGDWIVTTTGATTYTVGGYGGTSSSQVYSDITGRSSVTYQQLNPTFALNTLGTISTTGNVNVGGNLTVNGTGGNIITKASGFVNAGVDVTLGNLKARIPTSGNRSLQISTVTGTYSVYGSDLYAAGAPGAKFIDGSSPLSVTTTPAYLSASNHFGAAGQTDTWLIMDSSVGIAWRITFICGSNYNNNMISMERLV